MHHELSQRSNINYFLGSYTCLLSTILFFATVLFIVFCLFLSLEMCLVGFMYFHYIVKIPVSSYNRLHHTAVTSKDTCAIYTKGFVHLFTHNINIVSSLKIKG